MRFLQIGVVLFTGALLFAASGRAQVPVSNVDLRNRPIAKFSVSELPLLDVLQFGRETDVPLGIEYVDSQALRRPIKLSLHNQTFTQVLDLLLNQEEGYFWTLEEGVVAIRNRKLPLTPSLNLLELRISQYTLSRPATLAEASTLLHMELDVRVNRPHGFVGSYNPGNVREKIGPTTLADRTVVQILNFIVRERRHAAWIATAPPEKLTELPQSGLWRIIEYSEPAQDYASSLLQLPQFRARSE